jgi:predicted nucleic-acid-binding Zn-ribbon protein
MIIDVGVIVGNSTVIERLETPYWLVRCNNCGFERKLKYASVFNLKFYKGCVKCRHKNRKADEVYVPPTPESEILRQQFICGKFDPKIQRR